MIDLATPDAFYIDPGLVWQFYSWRRYHALQAKPNAGHVALAKLSTVSNLEFITITQNVDGLSIRAGTPKDKLFEIHGSVFDLQCTSFTCNYEDHDNFQHPLTKSLIDTENEFAKRPRPDDNENYNDSPAFRPVQQLDESQLPRCPVCKDLLRPGVVWFGESLPFQKLNKIDRFIEEGDVDLILVIGTSGTVYPANSYVDRIRFKGGKVAIFNTDIDEHIMNGEVEGTWGFKGDAAQLLPLALSPLIDPQ